MNGAKRRAIDYWDVGNPCAALFVEAAAGVGALFDGDGEGEGEAPPGDVARFFA